MLKVVVKNAEELARQRGPWAGLAAQVAPSLVRQVVDVEIARQLREQMAAQGVKVEVLIEANPAPRRKLSTTLLWVAAALAAVCAAFGMGLLVASSRAVH